MLETNVLGIFFCPKGCTKIAQNVPLMGCLAGCFFGM
jgi:hypothetical protein